MNTDEFLENINTLLLDLEPSKIFINIGTNDITEARYGDKWMSHLMDNFCKIIETTKDSIPNAEIYIMAFYPANLHLPWHTEEAIQMNMDKILIQIYASKKFIQCVQIKSKKKELP